MNLSRELIVAAKARADAATDGPWDANGEGWGIVEPHGNWVVADMGAWLEEGGRFRRDTDFIAAAREDVPVMADALLRVLDLHTEEPWFDAGPDGRDVLRGSYCEPCREAYPCATVRAVTGQDRNHD